MKSLRARLVVWLLLPLAFVGIVAEGIAYVSMHDRLTTAYDQDLGDIARALVPFLERKDNHIVLTFTPQADAVLRSDSSERIFYAVLDSRGELLAGDPGLPAPPSFEEGPIFWDASIPKRRLRMTALHTIVGGAGLTVVAAETTGRRDAAARDALLSTIAPVVALLAATLAAILIGVRRGLVPIELLRAELRARSHLDLRPVGEHAVAAELQPLVRALNDMLRRLDEAQHVQTRFIADAAHQLRTPIAGLVTQLDLAVKDATARDAHLEQAREAARRLARLAQQILQSRSPARDLRPREHRREPGRRLDPCGDAARRRDRVRPLARPDHGQSGARRRARHQPRGQRRALRGAHREDRDAALGRQVAHRGDR
jgi:two-component system sensor histidine kinase TctE